MPQPLTTISIRELQRHQGYCLHQVEYQGKHFLIEKAGQPKTVLISLAESAEIERVADLEKCAGSVLF